ncbi:alpha-hydroxy-acid oxidizing protein [Ramlibacter sp. USB13]|uniref:Alpha-hydroxy-acid oxidizing protein n=1 Tax=Ramlibacter cellulosilyticus TaxID=2764187 RepID=A0A923SBU1_9BURK|nr:alpha-hydroxy acid oxidase [Ramlibacter cellulosilyticus]MBC5784256.1 alpha-hydroxy-acid oxidizing protein [Ramlibacter cellulosilyticus]
MNADERYLSLHDFETAARARLPRGLYGFVAGGSADGWSAANNRAAFDRWALVPRTLAAGPTRRQDLTLFGQSFASPCGIPPLGVSALFCFDADAAMARAAAAARVPFILSGASLTPMERIFAAWPQAWFQAYVDGDRARISRLLARLHRTSCQVLVLTVDTPVPPSRELSLRHGFSIPVRPGLRLMADTLLHPGWLLGTAARTVLAGGIPRMENQDDVPLNRVTDAPAGPAHPPLSWDDFRFIRGCWDRALVVKGVVSAQDALRYRALGADGLVLSNHGGRQLDGTIAPLDALPAIRDAVPGLPLLLDGGIRRGTDVAKALALGAVCTFTGRPILFAAAAAGEGGVARALALMHAEIDRTQALLGARTLAEIGPAHLAPATEPLRHAPEHGSADVPDVPALGDTARAGRLAA